MAAGIDMNLYVVGMLLGAGVGKNDGETEGAPVRGHTFRMRRTKANDCRTLSFDVVQVHATLFVIESYPRWWPAQLRVRVLKGTPDRVSSRIEVRPRGGVFACEVGQVISPEKSSSGTSRASTVAPKALVDAFEFGITNPAGRNDSLPFVGASIQSTIEIAFGRMATFLT